MRKVLVPFIVLAVLAIGATAVSAQWVNLGTKTVDDRAEQDTFHITGLRGDFHSLQFRVKLRPVHFYRMRVTFGNGQTQEVNLSEIIKAGKSSRVIDLPGNDRVINKVDFWYESASVGRGKKSEITLWGKR